MLILLVEDHRDIADSIGEFLSARGHAVDFAFDGVTGLHLAVTNHYDALVLDLGLPGMDGLTLMQRLRADAGRHTPLLVLTARDTLADKLQGFRSGADDYLVKPFSMEELEARLVALHRRASGEGAARKLRVADLELDEQQFRVTRAGQPLHLGPIAFQLLAFLMRETHRVVRRVELERHLWGDEPPSSDALRTHIAGLRQAVDKPFGRALIHTVHGVGYRLTDDNV